MKMEWDENALYAGSILLAEVARPYDKWVVSIYLPDTSTLTTNTLEPFDTIEAAKAAAEQAVRKWFREAETELAALKERLAGLSAKWRAWGKTPDHPAIGQDKITAKAKRKCAADLDAVLNEGIE